MRIGVVPEFDDEGVVFERGLHDAALHAATAAMDDANFFQAGGSGGIDVFTNDRGHIARREGVQIELVLDRNTDGLFTHGS